MSFSEIDVVDFLNNNKLMATQSIPVDMELKKVVNTAFPVYKTFCGRFDVVYTDLEKAFDKVPHRRLISKLYSYGVNEEVIMWVSAFLSNRRQQSCIEFLFIPTQISIELL